MFIGLYRAIIIIMIMIIIIVERLNSSLTTGRRLNKNLRFGLLVQRVQQNLNELLGILLSVVRKIGGKSSP
ncbi:hypothetical protein D3C86_2225180 [compost metagenome]